MEGEDKPNNYSQAMVLGEVLPKVEGQHKACKQSEQRIKFRGQSVPITQIIHKQVKAIRTNEEAKMGYSVSAFELFKAVYENKVTAVYLTEMSTSQFEKFLKWIHPSRVTQPNLRNQYLSFTKSLKLTVSSTIQFQLQPKKTSSALSDFYEFAKLFLSLSDITVVIKLGKWTQVQQWKASLRKLWQSLTTIKKIKIEIKGQMEMINSSSIMRSLLFGGLACLTEISHLSFYQICFTSVGTNDCMAIYQSLRTVFQKNKITSFKLKCCNEFGIFGELNLFAIDISNNINLTHLDLSSNQLSAIDVSNNINLTQLRLSSNQLSAINVSKNINLTQLSLGSNQLFAIDVRNNINLTDLDLGENKLSTIDVSNCTKLTWLSIQCNSLEFVLLSFSSLLQDTNFSDQQSAVCEVQLLYKEEDSQRCNKQAKEWTEEYCRRGQCNRHGCNYAFVCSQRK